jgi:hypothetical protein
VYPGYSNAGGAYTSAQIKKAIGGDVNANYIDNTCAVRMSRALNNVGGHDITQTQYDPVKKRYDSFRGGDGKQYIFRVTGLARYLTSTYGSPDVHSQSKSSFVGRKGIMIMRLKLPGSSSYTGHVALWDGAGFYQSKDYVNDASDMWLWGTTGKATILCISIPLFKIYKYTIKNR